MLPEHELDTAAKRTSANEHTDFEDQERQATR